LQSTPLYSPLAPVQSGSSGIGSVSASSVVWFLVVPVSTDSSCFDL